MRHQHRGAPHMKIRKQRPEVQSTLTHVYHATKGWRKIGRDPGPGRQKMARLFARANIYLHV